MIDDVITSEEGTPFLLCTTLDIDEERFDGLLKQSAKQQLQDGIGGEVTKIGGHLFITIKVTMGTNDGHGDIRTGMIQKTAFETAYKRHSGFNLKVDGLGIGLPFYWSHLVDEAERIMLFGALHQGTRNFYRLFKDKSEERLLFHVFSRLAVEYRGDALASTQLHGAYYRRLSEINFTKIGRAYKDGEIAILKRMTATTLSQKVFIRLFDGYAATNSC